MLELKNIIQGQIWGQKNPPVKEGQSQPIKKRNQVSSRVPEWIESVTNEVIKDNKKLIEELVKKGLLIPS